LGTIASLSMGIADFPVEIFKAFKAKPKESKDASLSTGPGGSSSPKSVSRRQSITDLTGDATSQEVSGLPSDATPTQSSASTVSDPTPTPSSDSERLVHSTSTPPTSATTSSSGPRGSSLKQALRGTMSRSRSQSRDRKPGSRSGSPAGQKKEFDPSNLTLESAIGASKGIQRIVSAGLKSPMDFTMGLARGFHNAPKLYGDDTVRPQEKVTDFQSGLKAAGKVRFLHSKLEWSKVANFSRSLDMVSMMEFLD
jgi:hypothetical protein